MGLKEFGIKLFGLNKGISWTSESGVSTVPPSVLKAIQMRGTSSAVNKLAGDGNMFYTACYSLCPTLQSIIQKKGEGLVNGKLIAVDPITEKAKSSDAFNKAMKVLSRPNALMNRSTFEMYINACINVYGIAYVYKVIPDGMNNVTGLVPIPNNTITPQYKTSVNVADPTQLSNLVEAYTINILGMPLLLRGEDAKLIHEIRGSSINLTSGYEYKPYSRIDSLRVPITNIVASMESRNQIIVKRGAEGIISPKASGDQTGTYIGIDPKIKAQMQEEYAQYGYLDGQWKTILAQIPLDYTPITRNVAQLGLFEGENSDKRTVALAYNMPAPIIGLPDEAKYNTFSEAQRQMYEGAVIPDASIISQAYDEIFKAEGFKFYYDFSHLACFQKSEMDRATALDKTITALTNGINAGLIEKPDAKRIVTDFLN